MTDLPRLIVAGTSSGAGKTTVATGLMAALRLRGRTVAGFKVGPDFIDPGYHELATGRPGRNLDAVMAGEALLAPLAVHGSRGADIAVIEGVMGLFDGRSGGTDYASTAHVAKALDAPVLLVVDAKGAGRSVAAVVHGFATYDPSLRIAGVVLNRVGSEWHEEILRTAIGELGIPVVGALGRRDSVATPERHLGLVPVAERLGGAREAIAEMGAMVAEGCDLEAIVALAASAGPLAARAWSPDAGPAAVAGGEPCAEPPGGGARIGVARGPAFSFQYEENLELLRAAGIELVEFDPLHDFQLPEDIHGLLLTGGFPEVHAAELAANRALREQIASFSGPIVAECGGLLYLAQSLDGKPMCGVVACEGEMRPRLTLGYREAEALSDSPLWRAGELVRGHEFHHSRVTPDAGFPSAWRMTVRGTEHFEGFVTQRVHASYLHTHWAAYPQAAWRFAAAVAAAAEFAGRSGGRPTHLRSA